MSAKQRLLAAALMVIRAKGYAATSVDELCAAAGVTKGAFFHHFKSKDDLAIEQRGIACDGWMAESLALHVQAVLQGAFILAKAEGRPGPAIDSVDHLRCYIELLFEAATTNGYEEATE